MQPVLFEFGPLTVYSYGVFAALGFAAGAYVTYRSAQHANLSTKNFVDLCLYTAVGALVGARLWYVVFRPDEVDSFWQLFTLGGGGLAWPGGVFLGTAAFIFALNRNREPIWPWLDVAAIGALVGLAVGKVGSFLNGDGFGSASGLPWAVEYTNEFSPGSVMTEPVHPVQLYAAVMLALAAFGLWWWRERAKEKPQTGMVFWAAIAAMAGISLALEPIHATVAALAFEGGFRAIVPTALALIALAGFAFYRLREESR